MLVFLYMTTLQVANKLLDTASKLNSQLENSYLALSLVLVEIHDTEAYKETGYDNFADYYKNELGREKTTMSRLMTAGRFLKEKYGGKLPACNPSYRRLAQSVKRNPDADAEHILSEALTWTDTDYKDQTKEDCVHSKPPVLVCPDCWKRMDKCRRNCPVPS